MRKLSIPIILNSITEKNVSIYIDDLKKCKADRVFLTMSDDLYRKDSILDTHAEKVRSLIELFKKEGFEVGIWISAFGHGHMLAHQRAKDLKLPMTKLEGINGDSCDAGYCPLDKNFRKIYSQCVEKIAAMHPHLIMLDDDFRMNVRGYYMGCFCPQHLEEYYKIIGEEIPRNQIEKLILTGGKNKYRSAYLSLMGETLLDFAKFLRKTVDKVDSTVRMGACVCYDNWDLIPGPIEYAKALAGNTKPFMRTAGAPYWSPNVIGVIEDTRMEVAWCENNRIELFSEGDTYPRPRLRTSSKALEMFDLALLADGRIDGILKYMIDYSQKPDYERGYMERHIRNEKLREEITSMFADKSPIGVRPFNALRKIEDYALPDELEKNILNQLFVSYRSTATVILAQNSIATSYNACDYPVFVCGEDARHLKIEELKNGAILDVRAAEILKERGIDTGIVAINVDQDADKTGQSAEGHFVEEYFIGDEDSILNYKKVFAQKVECNQNAKILSRFLPENTAAVYLYENDQGLRFCVLAYDIYKSESNVYSLNYYRQKQLMDAIEWVGQKKLPAKIAKCPNLYVLTSAKEEKMSVLLINHFMDEIYSPVIELDKMYNEIRFVNCSGELAGDKVYLTDISPYSIAAFEVS